MTEAVRQTIDYRPAIASLRSEIDDPVRFESAVSHLTTASGGVVLDALKGDLAAEEAVAAKMHVFVQRGGVIPDGSSVADTDAGLATIAAERARLADWARWVEKRRGARKQGLGPTRRGVGGGCCSKQRPGMLSNAPMLPGGCRLRSTRAMTCVPSPIGFTRMRLPSSASTMTPRRRSHPRRSCVASLMACRRSTGCAKKSELGVLRHQLGLTRPSMPVRRLLESLPATFGKLAPCVLMSPLSVAQYLPAGQAAFDVVIFDEASQLTTWDAIGAIARARPTIIVGDPKQLPPTNFFGRADDTDEDLPEVERDLPSILDEVSAAGVRPYPLTWHYRSRDEALIAFSNHFYYGGGLVTFPAPVAGSEALKFHIVDGTYAAGKWPRERGGGQVHRRDGEAPTDELARGPRRRPSHTGRHHLQRRTAVADPRSAR